MYSRRGKHLQQTLEIVQRVTQFIQKYTKLEFTEMAADFTKDENGTWWLLNIRGFKVANPLQKPKLKAFTGWADDDSEENKSKNLANKNQKQSKNLKI